MVKWALFFRIDKGEKLSEKKIKNLRATGRNFVIFGERIGVAILQTWKKHPANVAMFVKKQVGK